MKEPPRRLHITGASGTGTSTLGSALQQKFGYVALDADDYFWFRTDPPFRKKRERAERQKKLMADLLKHPATVVSGSVSGWGKEVEQAFDLVIYLWVPMEIRIERLHAREVRLRGRATAEFLNWAAQYDEGDVTMRSRALHEKWLSELTCPVLRLEGDLSVEERLARIEAEFDSWRS